MYQSVKQIDIGWNPTDMDDRDSIYLDTISLASEFQNRKSLSQSRQTIYHSAEDVNFDKRASTDTLKSIRQQSRLSGENLKSLLKKDSVELARNLSATGDTGLNDEVSDRLLLYKNNKKMTVTYSQWKSRTWRRFQDGERSVDYVLAYRANDPHPKNADKRLIFETNLENEGLILEREETQRIHFVKIHAPKEVLCRYSEILKIKLPMKKLKEQDDIADPEFELLHSLKSFFGRPFRFIKLNEELFPPKEYHLKYPYTKNQNYLFDINNPEFLSPLNSIAIVHFILERKRYSENEDIDNDVGIEKLLSDGVYTAAYPLHDGDCNIPGSERNLLFTEWASVRKWIKHQPLDNIKNYFGVRVALYFAWLGFYTHMLIPASIVGLLCFLYGLLTLFSNRMSEEICNSNNSIIMCPQCDEECDFWYLRETCLYSRISYLFDNNLTVFFASFMSLWAVLYLELWKRYSARLIHQWGMSDFSQQAEHPRPQYLARLSTVEKKKFNVVHRVLEPHAPFWKVKLPIYIMNFSIIFLFICLAVMAVFGVIIYRMSLIYTRTLFEDIDSMSYVIMVLPITAAVLNLIVITILNFIYDYLAVFLTDLEYIRTQTEYEESLSLKIYLFQFINYYSSIFYIAFLKGKFVGYPAKYNRIFGLRQEECSPGGCLMELCIQLVIIMIGKQALNGVLEMLIPVLTKYINTIKNTFIGTDDDETDGLITCNQWTNDYKLLSWSNRGLFDEYLEMVIQYGFVTLFVVAFPLAPIFALLNNILEMRLDAKKILKYYRRAIPVRVKDIGIWFQIMTILGRIAVVSSAFIIAFSSNFIPRLVYTIVVNTEHTDVGYLNHTLAFFNPKDFQNNTAPLNSSFSNVEICRYPEYRNPPWADDPYKRPLIYWHILAARLAFIVVFQNVIALLQMIVAWAIPDTPRKLSDKIQREEYLIREIIIEQEKLRAGLSNRIINSLQNDVITSNNILNENGTSKDSQNLINYRKRKNKEDDIENTPV